MVRRALLVLGLALIAASAAGAHDRRGAVEAEIERLRERIAHANQREAVLTTEISAVTSTIRSLEADVAGATARLERLEAELAGYERRLAALTERLRAQTERLELLRSQYAIAQRRLNKRLVAIYQADEASALEVVFAAQSLEHVLDQLQYMNDLGELDHAIARQVKTARDEMRALRARTARTRAGVARATAAIRHRTEQQRAVTSRLIASRNALAAARSAKEETLASIEAAEREHLHEVEELERESRELAARLSSVQSSGVAVAVPSSGVSASGFIWPVSGPVTSVFGWRWGRMHEGIDIAAPSGTPVRAAASGTVVYSGWMGGYGNLVVLDHGGGLATAYAHHSGNAVGIGQAVVQGQVVGYVGCTGSCTGPHLHFEVRVNGAAVDPLGYL